MLTSPDVSRSFSFDFFFYIGASKFVPRFSCPFAKSFSSATGFSLLVCETGTVPYVSPLTPPQPQSGASSHLSTQGGTDYPAFDSASARRPKRSVRIADSPAATQPRRRSGSPRTSTPRRPAQPVSPQRRRTIAVQSKKAPKKGKVRVKAIRKR